MKTILTIPVLLSAVLLFASTALAVPLKASPQLLEKAIGLYSGKPGPFDLQYRSDLRVHELGFEIITYTFLSDGSEAGYVTRITSLMAPDSDGYFDLLLRLDAKKRIAAFANLVQPAPTGTTKSSSSEETPLSSAGANVEAFLQYLQGKDASDYKDALTIMINGLASGASLRDVKPLPPPPKDYVLDTTGKILLPGASMPLVKTLDLQGKTFSTEKMKGKMIMVFTAPTCSVCDSMIQALEKGLDLSQKRNTVDLIYVVGSEAAEAGTYLARLKTKGTGIAEPDDSISKAFKAPFRPYILMFEDGKMKFNFVWEKDGSKLYGFLYLLIEGKEPEGEDA